MQNLFGILDEFSDLFHFEKVERVAAHLTCMKRTISFNAMSMTEWASLEAHRDGSSLLLASLPQDSSWSCAYGKRQVHVTDSCYKLEVSSQYRFTFYKYMGKRRHALKNSFTSELYSTLEL